MYIPYRILGCQVQVIVARMAANGAAVDPAALEDAVNKAQEAVTRQGDIVRGLKAELKDGRVVRVS